jgi:hypothetical protein
MSDSQENSKMKTPWHLQCISIFALLWSTGSTLDYVMTQTRNASCMSGFTPEQLAFFYGLPVWTVGT